MWLLLRVDAFSLIHINIRQAIGFIVFVGRFWGFPEGFHSAITEIGGS